MAGAFISVQSLTAARQDGNKLGVVQFRFSPSIMATGAAENPLAAETNRLALTTATPAGLHDYIWKNFIAKRASAGVRAVDLGAGPGAMTERLAAAGCDVLAADLSADGYGASAPHVSVDFNEPDFASKLGPGSFTLATAVEVIEHVESPISFLRNVGRLLSPAGVAVITTPNVDSMPARVKFLLSGKIRIMDEHADPTHISPIFLDLCRRQFLSRAGIRLRERGVFPPHGFQLTRKPLAWALRAASVFFAGEAKLGDHHIFVVEPDTTS